MNQSTDQSPVPSARPTVTQHAGGTSIDMSDEHTRLYTQLVMVKGALSIEVRTGLKTSRGRSPLQVAQALGVTTKKTKKGALKDVEAAIARMLAEKQAVVEAGQIVEDSTGTP